MHRLFMRSLRPEMPDFAAAFLKIAMFLGDCYNELNCKK